MWSAPRTKYVCVPCRMVLRFAERCPVCRGSLERMYNFQAPKKKDDRGWKQVELSILVRDSNIQLCTGSCCVPIRFSRRQMMRLKMPNRSKLTLSQQKATIRKRVSHRQGGVPQFKYRYN